MLESRVGGPLHHVEGCVASNSQQSRPNHLIRVVMATSMDELVKSVQLPIGMELYSFMFEESDPAVLAGYVAHGKLPEPSTLLIGIGVGSILTVFRLLLDHVLFKVSGRWS